MGDLLQFWPRRQHRQNKVILCPLCERRPLNVWKKGIVFMRVKCTTVLTVTILLFSFTVWAETARFIRREGKASDYVVEDTTTGLMWQGCPGKRTQEKCSSGTIETVTWKEALKYCADLGFGGYDDWRLPNRRELLSIVNWSKTNPAIDEKIFPATPNSFFWTSSSRAKDHLEAWYVDFRSGRTYNGYPDSFDKTTMYHVRCVRDR